MEGSQQSFSSPTMMNVNMKVFLLKDYIIYCEHNDSSDLIILLPGDISI